ncbi:MAG: TetR/AcrR family transcriptional regulator [Pseudomonadota bacterium]
MSSIEHQNNTRHAILMTAMHLFAKEGIDVVSLRRISAESGSSNTAAVHYHFKDKTGLLLAVIAFLKQHIWEPGHQGLVDVVNAGGDIRKVIEAGMRPLKRPVLDFSWGGDAQAVMFRITTGTNEGAKVALSDAQDGHMTTFQSALRGLLPDLPDTVFMQRWHFMITEAMAGQWARARLIRTQMEIDTDWTPQMEREYLYQYMDYVVGGLTAPVTPLD